VLMPDAGLIASGSRRNAVADPAAAAGVFATIPQGVQAS